ncbi:MAG: hypothetical protein Kow00129_08290 [Thermoleophilia bacterium]
MIRSARPAFVLLLTVALLLVTAPAATAYDAVETELLRLINDYRTSHGLPALKHSPALATAAARHSADMARYGYFSHTSIHSSYFPAGSSAWDRMRLSGYGFPGSTGENIAAGQYTARQAFDAWRRSTGHNAVMLNSSFRAIGIGRQSAPGSPYGVYWTTDFGTVVEASSTVSGAPFTDVYRSDLELWEAAKYVKSKGYFRGYASGALGCWDPMTRRHVALLLKRAGLGSRPSWEQDYRPATRGEVMQAFPGLEWKSGRTTEKLLRSQMVRLLYRAR